MRPTVVPLVLALLALNGCFRGTGAARADALTIHADWAAGLVTEGSMERMREAIATLGTGDVDNHRALIALCRLAVGSPSNLIRADALRAAWRVSSQIPAEAYRVDEVDSVLFNERAMRLDVLLDDEGAVPSAELMELVDWVGSFRFPPGRLVLAVDLAEAVASRASAHEGTGVGSAFARWTPGSLRHALVLVTLHAAGDSAGVVREEAAQAARHLEPEAAALLLAGMFGREHDGQVIFRGLDSLEALLPRLTPEHARSLLAPLQDDLDVAVRGRARELMERLS